MSLGLTISLAVVAVVILVAILGILLDKTAD
jgi:F0F1-type ATP synthase assembly protein I